MADAKGIGATVGGAVAGPVGSAVGGVLGGLGGMFFGNKGAAARKKAWDNYIKTLQEQELLNPEDYVPQYEELDPAQLEQFQALQEQAILQGDTELSNLTTNPLYKDALMNTLAKYQRQADEGLTVADEADRNALLRSVATAQRGNQEALTQQMQRRGMLGSGGELAARMASSGQDYADAAAQAESLAKARLQAKQEALANTTNLASSLDNTEYSRAKAVADARDSINRFNVGQQTGVQTRNVTRQQDAANSNTGTRNDAYQKNVGLRNTQADKRVQGNVNVVDRRNQIARDIAEARLKKAGVKADQMNNIGKGVASLGSTVGDFVSKKWG